MNSAFQKITFTSSVRSAQEKYNGHAARWADAALDPLTLAAEEMEFIASRDSFYMATVGETGWPYIQHRGGPHGFLRVLDASTLGFADFSGNRQYISVGNLSQNNRVALFLMNYATKERLKILGHARVLNPADVAELTERLVVPNYRAKIERLFIIDVVAFDWNCPQHIHPPQELS